MPHLRQVAKINPRRGVRNVSNHWEALTLFVQDGAMPIDNNDVEQLMKQVALGRKNWLFVGSVAARQRR
jgi:hypothetical protein